jgi:hydrogenase nickel incorporation protein HypB
MCGTCGCGDPQVPGPQVTDPQALRVLELHRSLLSRNDAQAAANRAHFRAHGLLSLNMLSAPGSGKTALLEQLARRWPQRPIAVIVGDQATDNDARRLDSAGARAVQIRTGELCHLEADLVDRAFRQLELAGVNLLVIENVGNLVCPTAFDLGEELRLAVLAVGEGEDKPLKYPGLFRSADAVLLNKIDLLEATGFDRGLALANLRAIAPAAAVFEVSARSGAGLDALVAWLQQRRLPAGHGHRHDDHHH